MSPELQKPVNTNYFKKPLFSSQFLDSKIYKKQQQRGTSPTNSNIIIVFIHFIEQNFTS
jgi:hypothetical protein